MTSPERYAPLWFGLSAWTIIILAWLVNAWTAAGREQRLKRLTRLPVWVLISLLEAWLYCLADVWWWSAVYALTSIWALCELLRLQSGRVAPVLAGVISAAVAVSAEPAVSATWFLLLLCVLFALPHGPSVRLGALAGVCGGVFFATPPVLLLRLLNQQGVNELLYLVMTGVHLIDIVSGVAGKGGRQHPFGLLSPSKTSRGYVAGFLSSLAFAAGSALALGRADLAPALAAGTLLWLGAAAGDLAASKLKRIAGAKDFGTALGAHGGMGDRIDSVSPAIVLLALWISYGAGVTR